jgi:hypothetical protein
MEAPDMARQRIRVIDSPWPERQGLAGWDVTDELDPRIYPRHGLAKRDIIILLDRDPLTPGKDWSCVLHRRDVEYLDRLESDTPDRKDSHAAPRRSARRPTGRAT